MDNLSSAQTQKLSNLNITNWSDVLVSEFFPVDITPRAQSFVGSIQTWTFGNSILARANSSPARYVRRPVKRVANDQYFVLNFCVDMTLRLFGEGGERRFEPGEFMIYNEAGHWSWDQETDGELWSLRLPLPPLRERLGDISKFETYTFDLTKGAGRILFETVRLIAVYVDEALPSTMRVLQSTLIELLAVTLEEHYQAVGTGNSFTQRAHLSRIEAYIHANLGDPKLCPREIASACGISTRYLHELFNGNGKSLGRWILERRLLAAYRELTTESRRQTIAQVAFRWGFSDHAHFSRHFKVRFKCSPRDVIKKSRGAS